jgi:hypothetical protein
VSGGLPQMPEFPVLARADDFGVAKRRDQPLQLTQRKPVELTGETSNRPSFAKASEGILLRADE